MKLFELRVGGPISPWETLGFLPLEEVRDDGLIDQIIVVPDVVLKFENRPRVPANGLLGWSFTEESGAGDASERETSIDGISTRIGIDRPPRIALEHRLGVVGVDHVVVMTGSLDRTCAAITAVIGDPLRRVREAGGGVRQGFHKAGSVIIEVVERPDLDSDTPASLWGLVLNVADLDEVVAWLGPDAVGSPRDAVQTGRRIATVRPEVGLGVAVALMTPHP